MQVSLWALRTGSCPLMASTISVEQEPESAASGGKGQRNGKAEEARKGLKWSPQNRRQSRPEKHRKTAAKR